MTEGLGAGIVRFQRRSGHLAGHGVLVDDEHVATCAHVVNVALEREPNSTDSAIGEVIRVEFPLIAKLIAAPPVKYARVDAWAPPGTQFEGVDVAGLTLVSEPRPTGAVPMPLADEQRSAGDVLLYGAVAGRPGGWVTAKLRPLVTPHRQQIDQIPHGVFTAQPGFSGTPVVEATTGHVQGLLVATATGRDSTDVYAIPLSSLVSSWPDVFAPVPPSPYKGLRAFESEDRDLFFGRTGVIQELVGAVAKRGLVPVVGASGVGKSSVVHAGLLPRLEEKGVGWAFVTIRPRPTLLMALAAGFARLSGSGVPVHAGELEAWQDRLSRLGLTRATELACATSDHERLLLTVDQFEEVVSQDCDFLLRQFAELPNDGILTTVLTLREDSFGTFFVRHAPFGERLRQNAIALRGMDPSELEEVVRSPASLRGVRISDRLVDVLVRTVKDDPGALPLLEFSLDQMWRTLRPGQQMLSFDAYEDIGRVEGALAAHADKVVDGLDETEKAAVRKLFVSRLTSPVRPDTRQVVRRSEFTPGDWQIIVRLANERLLTIGRDGDGNETAEVVHEALLRAWGKLRDWLDAEKPFRSWRQLLHYAMAEWSEAEESGAFLTGALLAASERWFAERTADLDLNERRFIEVSLARRDEEEHRYRTLYRRSLSRALTHAAETAEDPILALLLATEVLERSADAQADRLIRTCVHRLRVSEIVPMPAELEVTAFDRARRRLRLREWSLGPGPGNHWQLGDYAAGLIVDGRGQVFYDVKNIIPMPGPVVVAAHVRAGVACLGTEVGVLAVWQFADRAMKVADRDLGVPIVAVAISETGQTVTVACDDGRIRVLNGEDLSDVDSVSLPGFIRDVDIDADHLVAALSYDRRVHVWDLLSQALICETASDTGASRLALDGSEDHVIIGDHEPSGLIPFGVRTLGAWARKVAGRELTVEERRRYVDDVSA